MRVGWRLRRTSSVPFIQWLGPKNRLFAVVPRRADGRPSPVSLRSSDSWSPSSSEWLREPCDWADEPGATFSLACDSCSSKRLTFSTSESTTHDDESGVDAPAVELALLAVAVAVAVVLGT